MHMQLFARTWARTKSIQIIEHAHLRARIDEVEDYRRGDLHDTHVSGEAVKPLQAVPLLVKGPLGKADLAVGEALLREGPEGEVLTARRKFLLVVLQALLFVPDPLTRAPLVFEEPFCADPLALQQEVGVVAPFGFPDAHTVPSSLFAMTHPP
jgi:hypothetical protein